MDGWVERCDPGGVALRIYTYAKCDTCRKAKKWLESRGLSYEEVAIREEPPTREELAFMLEQVGDLKRLFNTSSRDYREAGLKDRWGSITVDEAFDLLLANGNLVKRPFALTDTVGLVGFKPDAWTTALDPTP